MKNLHNLTIEIKKLYEKLDLNTGRVRFTIKDENSQMIAMQFEMGMADFAELITGREKNPIIRSLIEDSPNLGKHIVKETRSVFVSNIDMIKIEFSKYHSIEEWLINTQQEEGWIVDPWLNGQRSTEYSPEGLVVNYTVYKYSETTDA